MSAAWAWRPDSQTKAAITRGERRHKEWQSRLSERVEAWRKTRRSPIERARLTGSPDGVRAVMSVPHCTCTANAMPTVLAGVYRCQCGWLSGSGVSGWTLRVQDELQYLGGQE